MSDTKSSACPLFVAVSVMLDDKIKKVTWHPSLLWQTVPQEIFRKMKILPIMQVCDNSDEKFLFLRYALVWVATSL